MRSDDSRSCLTLLLALCVYALHCGIARASSPAAPSLADLTPDSSSMLAAIAAVAVVLLTVSLAILGFRVVRSLLSDSTEDADADELDEYGHDDREQS